MVRWTVLRCYAAVQQPCRRVKAAAAPPTYAAVCDNAISGFANRENVLTVSKWRQEPVRQCKPLILHIVATSVGDANKINKIRTGPDGCLVSLSKIWPIYAPGCPRTTALSTNISSGMSGWRQPLSRREDSRGYRQSRTIDRYAHLKDDLVRVVADRT